ISITFLVLSLHSFPTRRSSDLLARRIAAVAVQRQLRRAVHAQHARADQLINRVQQRIKSYSGKHREHGLPKNRHETPLLSSGYRSEEHTSELQSRFDLVCRLLL